ncbi:hypothetical protein M433DRAFT_155091 [Acidomyces richmondensis BFW]|nr:MAG: hypothetical protein FE78DRAFT_91715 [Acidomyces sp. 'richmondensis']KYG44905.1 hypothetical protein M433DRAFT_155091 [Acidomyces richmondensis BFW]
MAPLSQIAIATSVLNRRVKDEVSYRKEYEQQKARIAKLEAGENADDENAEFQLKQERKALEETKAMFPQLRQNIQDALSKLEAQLEQHMTLADQASSEETTKAKDAIAAARKAICEVDEAKVVDM